MVLFFVFNKLISEYLTFFSQNLVVFVVVAFTISKTKHKKRSVVRVFFVYVVMINYFNSTIK